LLSGNNGSGNRRSQRVDIHAYTGSTLRVSDSLSQMDIGLRHHSFPTLITRGHFQLREQ
jgi:hypothetical protein